MGISSDGILTFGICVDEGEVCRLPWRLDEEDEDIEAWIAAECGIASPGHSHYQPSDWTDYWAKQREVVGSYPIEEVCHCSDGYPMYILALRGTSVTASRGCPEVIDAETLAADRTESIQLLREFCAK